MVKTATTSEVAPDLAPRGNTRILYMAALAVILTGAAALRIYCMQDESLWFDEIITIKYLDAPNVNAFLKDLHPESPAVTPAYFVIEYAWAHLVSDQIIPLRLLSVLMGVLSILLLYLIAAGWFGPPVGLLAATLAALNPQHIFFSQEIRMYIAVFLFAVAAVWSLDRALNGRGTIFWCLNGIFNFLVVWTHPFAALVYIPQAYLILITREGRRRRICLWPIVPALSVISAGLWLKAHDTGEMFSRVAWIDKPTILKNGTAPNLADTFLLNVGKHITSANAQFLNRIRPLEFWADILLYAGVATALIFAAVAIFKRTENPSTDPLSTRLRRSRYIFLFIWLTVPPAILFALSYVWSPCFLYRYFLHTTAALFILIAAGVMAVNRPALRWTMLALVLLPLGFQAMLVYTAPVRAPWDAAARAVDIAAPRQVPIVGTGYHNVYALKFYMKVPRRVIEAKDVEEIAAHIRESLAAHKPIMAIVSDPKLKDYLASVRFEQILRQSNITFNKTAFPASIPVHLYQFP